MEAAKPAQEGTDYDEFMMSLRVLCFVKCSFHNHSSAGFMPESVPREYDIAAGIQVLDSGIIFSTPLIQGIWLIEEVGGGGCQNDSREQRFWHRCRANLQLTTVQDSSPQRCLINIRRAEIKTDLDGNHRSEYPVSGFEGHEKGLHHVSPFQPAFDSSVPCILSRYIRVSSRL